MGSGKGKRAAIKIAEKRKVGALKSSQQPPKK
jgi:hypothetical protein